MVNRASGNRARKRPVPRRLKVAFGERDFQTGIEQVFVNYYLLNNPYPTDA